MHEPIADAPGPIYPVLSLLHLTNKLFNNTHFGEIAALSESMLGFMPASITLVWLHCAYHRSTSLKKSYCTIRVVRYTRTVATDLNTSVFHLTQTLGTVYD